MSKKRKIKDDILEALRMTDELLGVREIRKEIRALRIGRALKELEAEGLIEWDNTAQGWKVK